MRSTSELVWIPAVTDYWWTNTIYGVKFGDGNNLTNAYKFGNTYKAFTDTGSSCTYIPSDYHGFITNYLTKNLTDKTMNADWGWIFWCSEVKNMPKLKYKYGDYWLESLP
jgi:hypothetical protein